MMERYPSVLLARATDELGKLPGVGPKTALRLALHLLKQPVASVDSFADAISEESRKLVVYRLLVEFQLVKLPENKVEIVVGIII